MEQQSKSACLLLISQWISCIRKACPGVGVALILLGLASTTASADENFKNWENHPVHPVEISPDGSTLAVVNLPDNSVELFALGSGLPVSRGSVSVGLDPVSLRFRNDSELWVANHISDTVSVVDVATQTVVATVQTMDEPFDLVFAGGPGTGSPERVFISCSQVNFVQVMDPETLQVTDTIEIDAEDPRALAVSTDRRQVYLAIFESSNATTLISGGDRRSLIPNAAGGDTAGPLTGLPPNTNGPYGGINPPPNTGGPSLELPGPDSFEPAINPDYLSDGANPAPAVGLIVRKDDSGRWMDDNNADWTEFVSGSRSRESLRVEGWDMPDRDVAVIDAAPPHSVSYSRSLMNMNMAIAVNPASGQVNVVGTDATNEVRFEPNVNGTFVRVMLGAVNADDLEDTRIVDLNAGHLDYSVSTLPQAQRDLSVGDPRGMVWNASGSKAYVAGMGSNNVITIDQEGSRAGAPIEVGEGPIGLALDEARQQLYVFNRFESSLSVVDTATEMVRLTIPIFDPTPAAIKRGRRHLYDTHATSGLGQASCASCHVDARIDRLAWDLGDPSGLMQEVVGTDVGNSQSTPPANSHNLNAGGSQVQFEDWHPMKGPMTTQTLQDIIGLEPFHHRGDQDGLESFNGAYVSLQGDDSVLTDAEMQEFEDFLATIEYPPNPFRNLDNTLATDVVLPGAYATGRFVLPEGAPLPNGNARNGLTLATTTTFGATRCVMCHTIPTGMGSHQRMTNGAFTDIPPGMNGEAHLSLHFDDTTVHRGNKIQGWRNLYEKVGADFTHKESNAGFGLMNDGREDTIVRRAVATIFNFGSDQNVADFVAFVMSFSGSDIKNPNPVNFLNPPGPPSNDTHAGAGKQITVTSAAAVPVDVFDFNTGLNFPELSEPADTVQQMIAMASPPDSRLDLVVKGGGEAPRGWFYSRDTSRFLPDDGSSGISRPALLNSASPLQPLTFTLVPRGSGERIALDRDSDGILNGEERAGSNTLLSIGSAPPSTGHSATGPVVEGATLRCENDDAILNEDAISLLEGLPQIAQLKNDAGGYARGSLSINHAGGSATVLSNHPLAGSESAVSMGTPGRKLYVPTLLREASADNSADNGYQSYLAIQNTHDFTQTSVTIEYPGKACSDQVVIPAAGSRYFSFANSSCVDGNYLGSAVLVSTTTAIAAFAEVSLQDGSTFQSRALSSGATELAAPLVYREGATTTVLSLINTGDSDTSLTVQFQDLSGSVIGQEAGIAAGQSQLVEAPEHFLGSARVRGDQPLAMHVHIVATDPGLSGGASYAGSPPVSGTSLILPDVRPYSYLALQNTGTMSTSVTCRDPDGSEIEIMFEPGAPLFVPAGTETGQVSSLACTATQPVAVVVVNLASDKRDDISAYSAQKGQMSSYVPHYGSSLREAALGSEAFQACKLSEGD